MFTVKLTPHEYANRFNLEGKTWRIFKSLEGYKESYREILKPYIQNNIMSSEVANKIYKLVLEKYPNLNDVGGIEVYLKNGYNPTDTGSILYGKLDVGGVKWYIRGQYAGGTNTLLIKTYDI
jgi:hypothetical protein